MSKLLSIYQLLQTVDDRHKIRHGNSRYMETTECGKTRTVTRNKTRFRIYLQHTTVTQCTQFMRCLTLLWFEASRTEWPVLYARMWLYMGKESRPISKIATPPKKKKKKKTPKNTINKNQNERSKIAWKAWAHWLATRYCPIAVCMQRCMLTVCACCKSSVVMAYHLSKQAITLIIMLLVIHCQFNYV